MGRPKKQQRLRLEDIQYKGTGGATWRVSGYMPDGQRVRKNFRKKTDALRHLSDLQLEIEGNPEPRQPQRTIMDAVQVADAEAAYQQLGTDRSLSETIAHYENLRRQATESGVTLDEVISFFQSRYRPETTEITVFNAKKEYLASRQHIAGTTRANYEQGIKLLLKPDPNKLLHTFTVADLEKILSRYSSLQTQRSFRTTFSTFFRWAVRHHYCLENPCDRFDKLPKEMSKIAVLSLDECKRLLRAALELQDGAAAATVAIGLFAGLRPSEIHDLKPANIMSNKIRVEGGKMRRTLKRSVPIPPVLADWLKEYPFAGLPVGWQRKMRTLKAATNAERWVKDIVRHTSITFQTDRDENEGLTARNCGTSVQTMHRHYLQVLDDDKAVEEFWSLTPATIRGAAIQISLPSKKQVTYPPKDKLKMLAWKKPLVHVAKDLGVSDVALKKHCVKLGIELPPRGYWLRT